MKENISELKIIDNTLLSVLLDPFLRFKHAVNQDRWLLASKFRESLSLVVCKMMNLYFSKEKSKYT